jgi:antitoxin MazE
MQVARWGNSLAVRLPAAVVEALQLKEGDEIEIHIADARQLGIARKPGREELLKRLRGFRGRLPPDFIISSTGMRRMPDSFFDTNVLVYIASGNAVKADQAEAIIAGGGAISVQVLNERTNVARRKMLWCEDMQHEMALDEGLRIANPFLVQS